MPIETASKVALISAALVALGEKPCTSLSDDRYGVEVGNNLFERVYQNELCRTLWRFAMKKQQLSRDVATPINEWSYQFTLPADCLMPVAVWPRGVCYEIFGRKLYSNAGELSLDYIEKIDPGLMPAYFYELMLAALARDMALPVTGSEDKAALMRARYKDQLPVAQWADAQGRPNVAVGSSPFTEVR